MSSKKTIWVFLLFIIFTNTLLFNNCAGQMQAENSSTDLASSSSSQSASGAYSGSFIGNFEYVSTDGRAWGYAVDSKSRTTTLKILFYVHGPVGTGTYLGSAVANQSYVGINSGHYFSYKIPANLMTGQAFQIYAYVDSAKATNLISPGAMLFSAYTPKAESFFNSNIYPTVSSTCNRCHDWTYRGLYSGPLMNPLPSNGGSPTNNKMIRKLSGLEGHSGGRFCDTGVDSGICLEIQKWWKAEFQ